MTKEYVSYMFLNINYVDSCVQMNYGSEFLSTFVLGIHFL